MTPKSANQSILITKHVDCLEQHLIQELALNVYTDNAIVKRYSVKHNDKETLCSNTDIIISTLGVSLPKETYFDAILRNKKNFYLLEKAKLLETKKIILIVRPNPSLRNDTQYQDSKKEFLQALKNSGIAYNIIYVDTIFSDFMPLLNSVCKNPFLFLCNEKEKYSPIHLKDLARVIINSIKKPSSEIYIKGPETLSKKEISVLAYKAFKKKPILITIPSLLLVLKKHFFKLKKEYKKTYYQFHTTEAKTYSVIEGIALGCFFNNEVRKIEERSTKVVAKTQPEHINI